MPKKPTKAEAVKLLQAKSHQIDLAKAKKMAKKYQKFAKALAASVAAGAPAPADTPPLPYAYQFNKKGIQKLLKETGAVGLRIYPGLDDQGQMTLVLVAFDENGNNITYPPVTPLTKDKAGKARKALKSGGDEDPNEGVLDDTQICPPYPAPTTP